ncbi:MAG: trypsin-like peptidase domain-containing protein [Pseudomonadales bacterium]|nr:trypsin-like peptidase domain-containing protein [Pseudomonadales bacterium]
MIIISRCISKVVIFILLMGLVTVVNADIYRYQDEKGRWHFTDKPPGDDKKADVIDRSEEKQSNRETAKDNSVSDIRDKLYKEFDPQTPVDRATLSVVTVETAMGTGSGFFVSEDCHIVTNRHVIRPVETKTWKKQNESLEKEGTEISKQEDELKSEKERLVRYKRSLEKHKLYIESLPQGYERRQEQSEYDQYKEIYKKDLKKLDNNQRTLKDQVVGFKKRMSEFSLDSSLAGVARTFKVVLKDNSERKAQLVHISKELDLALLRINDCRSPYLELDKDYKVVQGKQVYSIGSPLGQRDHLTSGVITNVRDEAITIDAQILPGNSGGPLINEDGKFIGVNTQKLSMNNPNSQGFGIAIPATQVEKALWSHLR